VQVIDDLLPDDLETIYPVYFGGDDVLRLFEADLGALVKTLSDPQTAFPLGEGLPEQVAITTADDVLAMRGVDLQVDGWLHCNSLLPGL